MTEFIDEESFELDEPKMKSPLSSQGRNNPISNGKMYRILDQLVDEAIWDKEYKRRLNKLYTQKLTKEVRNNLSKASSKIVSPMLKERPKNSKNPLTARNSQIANFKNKKAFIRSQNFSPDAGIMKKSESNIASGKNLKKVKFQVIEAIKDETEESKNHASIDTGI